MKIHKIFFFATSNVASNIRSSNNLLLFLEISAKDKNVRYVSSVKIFTNDVWRLLGNYNFFLFGGLQRNRNSVIFTRIHIFIRQFFVFVLVVSVAIYIRKSNLRLQKTKNIKWPCYLILAFKPRNTFHTILSCENLLSFNFFRKVFRFIGKHYLEQNLLEQSFVLEYKRLSSVAL